MAHHPEVDAYIARAAPFAQPVLMHLRAQVHAVCPDIEESIKWGFPHFSHRGMLCGMAAFKAHCAFGFWKHRQMFDQRLDASDDAMGQFGRITALDDLPDDATLRGLIARAVAFNESGARPKQPRRVAKPAAVVPEDLATALAGNPAAAETFLRFSVSNRREYIDWLAEAKTVATRDRRRAQAIEWMAEGKIRNWKYVRAK